ncbi:hypothetical protein M9H77_04800 [Catharanthus roseus]|uniref:Uncharacterized protein n=1 Tax=Catharanthus roseus TaxID=4058 RepID=A0ACC0CF27_CATRO|nr:hypothetical protein M9H77_04800 [Catharanthus roseus]
MAADERLTALQKAYADIILNTAKEAATRIMMSERKAQRFQRELQVAKDEGLRMLLRLKQMMDSKITEVELTSQNQQRKIEELEAQLQEAEDIVKDLREELREVQSELEWVRNNKAQHVAECQDVTQGEISEENRFHSSESVVFHPPESEFEYLAAADMRSANHFQRNECLKFCRSISSIGNSYSGCPDLPSIILRSKEPELYRNGCTQRIRASEGNLLDKELSLSGKITKKNEEISAGENESAKEISKSPTSGMGNLRSSKKKVQGVDGRLGNWQPMQSFGVKRKRANRYRNRFTSSRKISNLIFSTNQAPNVLCMETCPSDDRTDFDFDGGASQFSQRSSSCKSELGPQATCAEISQYEAEEEVVESGEDKNPVNDKMVTEKLGYASKEVGCIEIPTISVGETDVEKGNALLPEKSLSNDVAHETPSQPINERIIKITFQRKRKREPAKESNGKASLEKRTSNEQALDKQHGKSNGEKPNLITSTLAGEKPNLLTDTLDGEKPNPITDTLDGEKPNLITESSRDSRRLVQVARQLISLSEKKWWQ